MPGTAQALKDRVAAALGWLPEDVGAFSLQALRELVRATHPKLAGEIEQAIRTGACCSRREP